MKTVLMIVMLTGLAVVASASALVILAALAYVIGLMLTMVGSLL